LSTAWMGTAIGGLLICLNEVELFHSTVRAMPEKRKRQATNIREGLAQIVRMLADKENRNFTQQVHTLIEEAIAQREQRASVEDVERNLYELSVLELARVIQKASQIQEQKLKGVSNDKTPKVAGNALAAKALANQLICQQVFQELPDGEAVLQRIIEGEKPPDEALPLLGMCLSIDADELDNLLEQSFGNEPNHNHS